MTIVALLRELVVLARDVVALLRGERQRHAQEPELAAAAIVGAKVGPPTGRLPRAGVRGRDEVLRELRVALRRAPGQVQVLAGVGGVGKSTIALALTLATQAQTPKWGRRHRGVWWVSAADAASLTGGITSLARELGGRLADLKAVQSGAADAPDRVWSLLLRARRGWLLVVDNADDPCLVGAPDGNGWLRRTNRGLLVVTTRTTEPHRWGSDAKVHRVDLLPEADAARVLLDLAPKAGDATQAQALARRLGCFPLALHAAGRYLGSSFVGWRSFDAYLHALDTKGVAHVLTAGTGTAEGEDRRGVVTQTWELSLDGLADHGVPQARPLLRLLSCYAPATPIPGSLLDAHRLGGLVACGQSLTDDEVQQRVEQGLRGLAEVGLIDIDKDRHAEDGRPPSATSTEPAAVMVHPLIAETNRAHLDATTTTTSPALAAPGCVRQAAVDLIAAAADSLGINTPKDWPRWQRLTPHLRALLKADACHLGAEDLAALLDATTCAVSAHVWRRARAERAGEDLARDAIDAIDGTRLRDDHPAALRLRHVLAWAVAWQERWSEAEMQLQQVLADRRRTLGPDDPDTLETRHQLAWAIGNQGQRRWAEAETAFARVLAARVRLLGTDHPDTLHTRCMLYWIFAEQGRLAEAEDGFRQLLDDRQRVLGQADPDDPDILDTRFTLAKVLRRLGRLDEAKAALRQVLDDRQRVLGPNDTDTLRTRHELACTVASQGRRAKAKRQLRRLHADQVRELGTDHPDTRATRERLEALRRRRDANK
jgi:tetratricopeptide (TPR) repeat protein